MKREYWKIVTSENRPLSEYWFTNYNVGLSANYWAWALLYEIIIITIELLLQTILYSSVVVRLSRYINERIVIKLESQTNALQGRHIGFLLLYWIELNR